MLNPYVPPHPASPGSKPRTHSKPRTNRSVLAKLNIATQRYIFDTVFSFLNTPNAALTMKPRRDGRLGCLYVQRWGFPRIRLRSDCWRIGYNKPNVASLIATLLLLVPGQEVSVQAMSYEFIRRLQEECGWKYLCYVPPPSAGRTVQAKHF